MQRGEFIGEPVETITYVCERPGTVTIPALVIHWWDVNDEELEQELMIGGDIVLEVEGIPISTDIQAMRKIRETVAGRPDLRRITMKVLRGGKIVNLFKSD